MRIYALDFPGSPGIVQEGMLVVLWGGGKAAIDNQKPVIAITTAPDEFPIELNEHLHSLEEPKTVCHIPLVIRGRALGLLAIGRTSERPYDADEIDFLTQVAGQIAIAIDNSLAYEEISELRDKLAQEKEYLEEQIRSELGFEQIIGSSAGLKHVLQLVETVASSDSTVLLLGETGTGKELIARAIHERSRRKERTFVKLNCAAIPTGLLESELFGHEKGAFTGAISQKAGRMELADQGTLFLDEVGDIPPEIQPKLLRALQEREFERLGSNHTRRVNVRLVAATNRDIEKMVADREFRSDLYYRLNVFPIRIPPLRNRKEDIPLLVVYFVQKFAKQMQKRIDSIPAHMMKGMTAWEWPGNIRELENFIERAVILTRGKSLEAPLSELRKVKKDETIPADLLKTEDDIARIVKETIASLKGKSAQDGRAKKQHDDIVRVLTECKGRVGGADGAAARMGISRTTLISRMKKLGINPFNYV
jgi:formate hydrogenlyase transcriptional activator